MILFIVIEGILFLKLSSASLSDLPNLISNNALLNSSDNSDFTVFVVTSIACSKLRPDSNDNVNTSKKSNASKSSFSALCLSGLYINI